MKKIFTLVLVIIVFAMSCIPWVANAQTTVTIGDGTETSYEVPIGTYYNYSITEMLYTADEIGMAGTISSISFYYMGIAAKDLPITVYMQNVDVEDLLTGISLVDADEVFSGTLSVTTTAGWVTIDLDAPFAYDGISNLLIGINKDYLYWFSGWSWQGTATSAIMARYTRNDNNPYDLTTTPDRKTSTRPNIQLVITAGSAPACAKPTGLIVDYNGGTDATVTWTSGAASFNIDVNGTVTNNVTNPYTITGLEPGTTYNVMVQANCGSDLSEWTTAVSFTTDLCMPENKCELTFVLTDSYGDGWNGCAIQVVDAQTGNIYGTCTIESGSSATLQIPVCDGRDVNFVWVKGSYPGETSWVIYDIDEEEITSDAGNSSMVSGDVLATYTVSCLANPCLKPVNLSATDVAPYTATLTWTENGTATAWQLCLNDDTTNLIDVTTNPYTLSGLTPAMAYSVKVRANCDGYSTWSNPVTFTTKDSAQIMDGLPCPGIPTVTDIDDNVYNTVKIGEQCWMKENLRATHYADGVEIPVGTSSNYSIVDVPYRYNPGNNIDNVPVYGHLYNWAAAMHGANPAPDNLNSIQGVCPNGWHLPNADEWTRLMDYVGSVPAYLCNGNSSNIAKALSSTTGWNNDNRACTPGNGQSENNATGFSAMPATCYGSWCGCCGGNSWCTLGGEANIWSSTPVTGNSYPSAKSMIISGTSPYLYVSYKSHAYSVRCILNDSTTATLPTITTGTVSDITATTATCGGNVTSEGSAEVTGRGVCWNTDHNPTLADAHTSDGTGAGTFTSEITELTPNTTYYVRAYAINSTDTVYGQEVVFTTDSSTIGQDGQPCAATPSVTDYDGNMYNTVQIGQQCWMKENLRTMHYTNGDDIPEGNGLSEDVPYRYNPNNNSNVVTTYGYLYNWPAVMHGASSGEANPIGVQGICPTGWHVPSDAEWTQLTDYVSSVAVYVCGEDNNNIARALAECTAWNNDNGSCSIGNDLNTNNNNTKFSVLPAGSLAGSNWYYEFGRGADFWTATSANTVRSWSRSFDYNASFVSRGNYEVWRGFSVRCIRDEATSAILPTVTTGVASNITTTTATCGGNVTDDGGATVTARGVCWSTSENPTIAGAHTNDGTGTGAFTSTLTGLEPNTIYYVRAYATNSEGTAYGQEVSFITMNSDTFHSLLDGLVAYYPFDDDDLTDHTGNGNNGTNYGTTSTADRFCREGKARNFAGIDNSQYIEVPNSSTLQFNDAATVSLWFCMNGRRGMDWWGNATETTVNAHVLFAKNYDQNGKMFARVVVQDNGDFSLGGHISNTWAEDTIDNLQIGQWVMATFVFTDTYVETYVNGRLLTRSEGGNSFATSNGNNLYFGRLSSFWYPLNGKMDDIRVFNRALSSDEVAQLYYLDIVPPDSLLVLMPLDGDMTDYSGNGFQPVIHGNVTSAVGHNDADSTAYRFPGESGSWIEIPHDDRLNLCGSFTVSAWYNRDEGWQYGNLVSKGRDVTNGWALNTSSTHTNGYMSGGTDASAQITPSDGNWHMTTGVYDLATSTLRYYLDGELQDEQSNVSAALSTENPVAIGRHLFSAGNISSYPYPFKGTIDDIVIYNRPLSAEEVQMLYDYNPHLVDCISLACSRPDSLSVTDVAAHTATLTWNENGTATAWQVCINEDETNLINVTTNPYTLTDLTPETAYTVKVRANCGSDVYSHWSNLVTFTTPEECLVPEEVSVSDITASGATVAWTGISDSYNVRLGWDGQSSILSYFDFENGAIPSQFVNDPTYEWTVVADDVANNHYIRSGNGGIHSSSSAISITVNCPADDTIEFDAECRGEGSSTYWDHSDFYIDDTRYIYAGSNISGWNHYSFPVTSGTHTFKWSYTKDGSVHPSGDYFAVDNIVLGSTEIIWGEPVSVGETEYTFSGLDPETLYYVTVQGVCDENLSLETPILSFTTQPLCPALTWLVATDIATHSVMLTWYESGTATAWQLCLNDDTTNLIDVTTNPYTLTGLTPETVYTVKMRANCDSDGYSTWSNPVAFTTASCPDPVTIDTTICPSELPLTWHGHTFEEFGIFTDTLTTADGCDSIVMLRVWNLSYYNNLLSDDFNDGVIDPNKWTYTGNAVIEEDGLLKMQQNVTDQDVHLRSVSMDVSDGGKVDIDRRFMVHRNSQYYYGSNYIYFNGDNNSYIQLQYTYAEYYDNAYYHSNPMNGIYLYSRVGGVESNVRLCNIEFDTWLTEHVELDFITGTMSYYMDTLVATVNIPGLSSQTVDSFCVQYHPYGWWTGHQHYMDYVEIHAGTGTVRTSPVTEVAYNTATCGGDVALNECVTYTATGVCWSTSQNPTLSDVHTTDGTGVGVFTSELTGLEEGTTYYVRAYALGGTDTVYGQIVSFTTCRHFSSEFEDAICEGASYIWNDVPYNASGDYVQTFTTAANCDSVVTLHLTVLPPPVVEIARVAGNSATVCEGAATAIEAVVTGGYGDVTSYQWYKNGNLLSGESNAVLNIENLTVGADDLYTVEVVQTGNGCTNTASASLNTLVTVVPVFTVSVSGPSICEGDIISLTATVDNSSGIDMLTYQWYTIENDASAAISGANAATYTAAGLQAGTFNYRVEVSGSASGCYAVSEPFQVNVFSNPVVSISGETNVNLGQSITLTATGAPAYTWSDGSANIGNNASVIVSPEVATTYSVIGIDENGCTGSASVTVTVNYPPTVTTATVSDITAFSATCGGNVTADGGANVTGRGVCWSTDHNPTITDAHTTDGMGLGAFTSTMTGLESFTTYYVRAYATNSVGTAYGEEVSFTTAENCIARLTVISNDPTYGTCTGSGCYSIGDIVTINAIPNQGKVFLRWSDSVTTNPREVVVESDTTFTAIFEYYLPELHVTSISHSDFVGGETATISWTVQNDGTSPTPNGAVWYDRVWLSSESRVAAADNNPIFLGEFPNVSALNPGEYYTQTQTFDIPLNLAGSYFLFVITDAFDAHHIYWDSVVQIPYNPPAYIGANSHHCSEGDCGNVAGNKILEISEVDDYPYYHDNFFYELVDVAIPPLPNLKVSAIYPTAQNFFSGTDVDFAYQVKNFGNYDTRVSDWKDMVFVSNSPVFDENAQLINSVSHHGLLLPDSSYQVSTTVSIPIVMQGTAWFYVYTDYYDQVYEHIWREDNVSRSDEVNIILTPPADLVPQNITADNLVSTGATFTFSYEVHNTGAGDPDNGSWLDRCYLSTSADSLENAIHLVDNRHYNGLASEDFYSVSRTIALPSDMTEGTYYLFVHTDVENNVFEYNMDANNLACSGQPILVVRPDLQIHVLNTADTLHAAAEEGISYFISNMSDGAVINQPVTDKVYLSPNADGADAVQIAELSHNLWLNPFDSLQKMQNMAIPGDLQDGYYYIFVSTNTTQSLNELDLTNNTSPFRQVYVLHLSLPDLVISGVEMADTMMAGDTVVLSVQLLNQGEVDANIGNLSWQLNVTVGGQTRGCAIGSWNADAQTLVVDATATVQMKALIPPMTSLDSASFELTVNPTHGVMESVYSNNSYGIDRVVRPYPFDLAVTELSSPTETLSGDSVTVSWMVENIGSTPSDNWPMYVRNGESYQLVQGEQLPFPWYDVVYLSQDNQFDDADVEIGRYEYTNVLNPGGTYFANVNCMIPLAAGGDYYVLIVNDATNVTFDCQRANNVRVQPIAVTPSALPDLQIDTLLASDTIVTLTSYQIHYTVSNRGEHITHNDSWTDALYFNSQPTLEGAQQLGTKVHNGQLDINASYTDSIQVSIPHNAGGDYYLIGYTDATDQTVEMNNDNNLFILPVTVIPCALPDLWIDTLEVPAVITIGETYKIQYTVSNGGEYVTRTDRWTDAFYLNSEPTVQGARHIGSNPRYGVLDINAHYTDSIQVTITNIAAGDYYLIGYTDATDRVLEVDGDVTNLFMLPVTVARPLPCDLTVLPPDIPTSANIGEDVEVSWTLQNVGFNPAQGRIKDAVYLSTDSVWSSDDIMLGSMTYTVNLASGGQAQRSATLTLQGVPTGDYYVVVKTNILNALNENTYTNNKAVSLMTMHVDYPSLYIGQEEQRELSSGQSAYYKLEVGPGYENQTLSCKLTTAAPNISNGLYIAYSSAPTTSNFNFSATLPYVQEQEILIPSLEQGTYYIMVTGQTSDNSTQNVTILASIINFEILSIDANSGANTGSVTTQIIGAKFDTIMDFRLANSNGYLPAEKVFFSNSTESFVTFNLRDQETGVYDVVAELPGGIITVKDQAFVIEEGLPAELLSNIIAPASVRYGNTFTVTVEYGNIGSTDLDVAGILLVSPDGFPIAFTSEGLSSNAYGLIFETAEPNGNPDVIRPGYIANKTIFVKAVRPGNINLKVYPIRRQY